MRNCIFGAVAAVALFAPPALSLGQSAHAFFDSSGHLTVASGSGADASIARGTFESTLNVTGWGVLHVRGGASLGEASLGTEGAAAGSFGIKGATGSFGVKGTAATDGDVYRAMGLVEGYLTAEEIASTYANLRDAFFPLDKGVPSDVAAWFDTQETWARGSIAAGSGSSPLWRNTGLVFAQYAGLEEGYRARASEPDSGLPQLPHFAFQLLNGAGDVLDVLPAINASRRVDVSRMTADEIVASDARRGMCSALIKIDDTFSELFMGHSAWFLFSNTNRIWKTYEAAVADPSTVSRALRFSSYPGFLESLDDFYMTGPAQGLGMVQTTNNLYDTSLFSKIHPRTLLAWQRVRLAFLVADSGAAWQEAFSFHASGTYTNSYMILDFKRFAPGEPLREGLLHVVEEIPDLIVGADLTQKLASGYYPSYNKPYFEAIYNASGYPAVVAKTGPVMSYDLCPRAEIFRRDQSKVRTLDDFKALLRQNDYLHDPIARDNGVPNPMFAICSRGDLVKPQPFMGGCYDTKVTSYKLFQNHRAQIINGPTTAGNTLPAFRWTPEFQRLAPHAGLPTVYNFSFVDVN